MIRLVFNKLYEKLVKEKNIFKKYYDFFDTKVETHKSEIIKNYGIIGVIGVLLGAAIIYFMCKYMNIKPNMRIQNARNV